MKNHVERLSEDSLAIYLFHGVIHEQDSPVRNYTGKHLPLAYFKQLMKELRGAGVPISMDEVLQFLDSGTAFPPRSFAVTFDDGFENNLTVAAPVLAELRIPTTFYVTSSFIEDNKMSWIDRIEYCIEKASRGALKLPWNDRPFAFQTIADKKRLLDDVRHNVKRAPDISPDALADDIFDQCGLAPIDQNDHPLDKKMNWAQIKKLAANPLFTVGGHTHTHVVMTHCSEVELEREVETSLSLLKQNTDIGPSHYSYPEGLEHCFSENVIALLKSYGVKICPTAIDGVNRKGADPFRLKRIMVG